MSDDVNKGLAEAPVVPTPLPTEAVATSQPGTGVRELDKVLLKGVAWTATVKWITQLMTWGMTVMVARLLLPSDYGLVGMAIIYINLFTLFSEFGIGTAVVTMQELSENQLSQLNMLSFLLGLVGFVISALAAIPLGKFFRAPNLPAIVLVLSIGFIISGIRTVPYSLLQKELRFKLLAVIEGLQSLVQAVVTLVLAFLHFRYWAIVLGILSFSIAPTILTLIWRRQGFAFPHWPSIRKAITYSRHIVIGRLCWASYNDSDFIVAGRVLGEAALGAYTLAWTLAHTPLEKLTTLVNRVTPSVFAKIQNDPVALRRYLENITGSVGLAIFPATIGIALVAPEFVPLILGSKWHAAIVPLQLLALHALIRTNAILLAPLLNVIGEEAMVMWNSIFGMFVLPISFYIGSRWETVGIAAVWVVVYPLVQIPLFSRVFRRIDLPRSEYLGTLWPAISSCAVMSVAIAGLRLAAPETWPLSLRLTAEVLVGVIAYAVALVLFHRQRLQAMLQFVKAWRAGNAYAAPVE
ncbi:MAG TPA: lipopolysaccharide biosynthesis protein [Candidatus Sulfotelmatobacter sp.]|nr:lipopolysaccharide biosynthesis protein [Candidatus Sulfotelmatobacter sp.]